MQSDGRDTAERQSDLKSAELNTREGSNPSGPTLSDDSTLERRQRLLCNLCEKPRPEQVDRFWVKVDKSNDCWLWTGARMTDGYGKVTVGHRGRGIVSAHRLSWMWANGPIPSGMCVLHKCDMPACVRPDHLFLGTQVDNMADRQRKGRQATGTRNGRALMTEDHVRAARTLLTAGWTIATTANVLGQSVGAIQEIKRGRNWKHVA